MHLTVIFIIVTKFWKITLMGAYDTFSSVTQHYKLNSYPFKGRINHRYLELQEKIEKWFLLLTTPCQFLIANIRVTFHNLVTIYY